MIHFVSAAYYTHAHNTAFQSKLRVFAETQNTISSQHLSLVTDIRSGVIDYMIHWFFPEIQEWKRKREREQKRKTDCVDCRQNTTNTCWCFARHMYRIVRCYCYDYELHFVIIKSHTSLNMESVDLCKEEITIEMICNMASKVRMTLKVYFLFNFCSRMCHYYDYRVSHSNRFKLFTWLFLNSFKATVFIGHQNQMMLLKDSKN